MNEKKPNIISSCEQISFPYSLFVEKIGVDDICGWWWD